MIILASLLAAGLFTATAGQAPPQQLLQPCRVTGVDEELRCGTYEVFENRQARSGRRLALRIVVIPAREPGGDRAPIFVIGGGPGQTATELAADLTRDWQRIHHDVVLVDQRGTGEGHRLDCRVSGSDDDLQGYLEPIFRLDAFRACRDRLALQADLRRYGTSDAMDDLDEVRRAMGYTQINLAGGSYGTRAILTYIRRHGAHVRAAVLTSPVPFSFRNPLYHARSAQEAWEGLVRECGEEPGCRTAYPNLQANFDAVRTRLRQRPARVAVRHPATGAAAEVMLSEAAFGEAVRVIMYRANSARTLPLALHRAAAGDYTPFAAAGLTANRGLRDMLRFGMLLSVVCGEDVDRIDPREIGPLTRGTYLADDRVRQQIAVCADWPRAEVPADYARELASDVPVLIFSGNLDPATTPAWGDETARYFPRSRHVVVPGGHAPNNDCTDAVSTAFLLRGSVEGLDAACATAMRAPPFALPNAAPSRPPGSSRGR